MAIYHLQNKQLNKIKKTTFSIEGILEKQNLQETLKDSIDIISPDTLVIAEEFSEWEDSRRRIDLLGLDKQANLIVIELKRNETGKHMDLQALRYAAMVSTLTFKRAIEIYQTYLDTKTIEKNAEDEILEFLDWNEPQQENFALDVKIVLVSADFSKEITTTVMWLNERNLDIRCVRLKPYKFQDSILLDIQQIIPIQETQDYQIQIREQSAERRTARKSSKDYTKYMFQGKQYNKRRLVLAVIRQYVKENPTITYQQLQQIFPKNLGRTYEVVEIAQKAKAIFKRGGRKRHFINQEDLLSLVDGKEIAVCNQWSKKKITKFLKKAEELGFEIEEA